jgi:hypothetical protein
MEIDSFRVHGKRSGDFARLCDDHIRLGNLPCPNFAMSQ